MLDHESMERLLGAVDPLVQQFEVATALISNLDATQRRELLAIVCEQSRGVGDDARRREFVQRVIDAHPDVVRDVGPFGETALHVAAYWHHIPMMRLLMDNGADPDQRTRGVWYYNDGKLPRACTPRGILERGIKYALEHDGLAALRTDPNRNVDEAAALFGLTFDQWVEQVRSSEAAPKPAAKKKVAANRKRAK